MERAPIVLTRVAQLDVSAASGLCVVGGELVVVADDQAFLARYGFDGQPRGRTALVGDALPRDHAARKRRKPDFEALAGLPDGRLIALGSGSTAARMRGVVIDPRRGFSGREIALGPLYAALQRELPELNVEGAAVLGDRLVLLQRGNGAARANAWIELDLRAALAAIDGPRALDAGALTAIIRVDLGMLDGVALSFTDAAPGPNGGLLFSAAAEDTGNTYDDGRCAGSVVGLLSRSAELLHAARVQPAHKIEGIACLPGSAGVSLWLVSDADDPGRPAGLFRAELPFTG